MEITNLTITVVFSNKLGNFNSRYIDSRKIKISRLKNTAANRVWHQQYSRVISYPHERYILAIQFRLHKKSFFTVLFFPKFHPWDSEDMAAMGVFAQSKSQLSDSNLIWLGSISKPYFPFDVLKKRRREKTLNNDKQKSGGDKKNYWKYFEEKECTTWHECL